MNFFDSISQPDLKLNATEHKILEYLLQNMEHIEGMKIAEVSNALYIAPNSVIRLCKKLGYSGFSQMKFDMAKAQDKKSTADYRQWMGSLDLISHTLKINSQETIQAVVDLIFEAEYVVFFGLGLSRLPAEDLAKKLRYLNKIVFVPDDRDNCLQYANNLKQGQAAFFFSCSGNTDIIVKLVHIVKTKNIPIISLTGISQNTLTNFSSHKLYAYVNHVDYRGIDLSSRTSFYFITDLIFNEYLKRVLVQSGD